MKPTLSIVLANYNHAHFLPQSLGAMLAQTRNPLEILIIDDASTDDSAQLIKKMISPYGHVRLIEHLENQGAIATGRELLDLSRGDYIYWAASDDYIAPEFCERVMSILSLHPEAGLCFSALCRVYQEEPVFYRHFLSKEPTFFSKEAMEKIFSREFFQMAWSSVVYRRQSLMDMGCFDVALAWHTDFFSVLAIAFRNGACYVPDFLTAFRVSDQSFSGAGSRSKKKQAEVLQKLVFKLQLLEYKDILPAVNRSGVLSIVDSNFMMLKVIIDNRAWSLLSIRLLCRLVFRNGVKFFIQKRSPKIYVWTNRLLRFFKQGG